MEALACTKSLRSRTPVFEGALRKASMRKSRHNQRDPSNCHPFRVAASRAVTHRMAVLLDNRRTVNSEWYTTICLPEIFEGIRKNNRQRRVIHHDNACCHTSAEATRFFGSNRRFVYELEKYRVRFLAKSEPTHEFLTVTVTSDATVNDRLQPILGQREDLRLENHGSVVIRTCRERESRTSKAVTQREQCRFDSVTMLQRVLREENFSVALSPGRERTAAGSARP
ncbi:hypothetical protein EVAR_66558_1 [Eumeta japonica]|uniref:Mariner Mos1 transposase n=1 Tax=Eumeta variegata TaxID=151549 RepID=A0A4C1ZCU2_EUMVA|nr:hypothetical protein EVAR_66558_1 [Eumeta japonica]